ncbi:MAG: site-2 protease family protein [Actinobacteria bacterium]|nr:site-2 protease family protein [Actinomycetota bacterium]
MFHANEVLNLVLFLGILIPSIILHEVAHGWVAERLGDPTAREAGRITINPIPHLDPVGSLLVPGVLAFSGAPVIGWAKPVPVSPSRLGHPMRDTAVVALAGPGTNFLIAAVIAIAGRFDPTPGWTCAGFGIGEQGVCLGAGQWVDAPGLGARLLLGAVVVNVLLGLFNLLPIPPLDGSKLVPPLLPAHAREGYYRLAPYGFLVLLALVFLVPGGLEFLWDAAGWILRLLV